MTAIAIARDSVPAKIQVLPIRRDGSNGSVGRGSTMDLRLILPAQLPDSPRWVCWRYLKRDQRWTKPPINPRTGEYASVQNPCHWTRLNQALDGVSLWDCNGVGIVLTAGDRLVGIDLDKCVDSSSNVEGWAWEIVSTVASYTEFSPSGGGMRIFAYGTIPIAGIKRGRFEMYTSGRYLTVTGNRVQGTPATIETRQSQLAALHGKFKNDEPTLPIRISTSSPTDSDLIRRACSAANGSKFEDLYRGNWQQNYASQSEADMALCRMLAYWTGNDLDFMDRLFRQSGLMRPKWEREDYRNRTLSQATNQVLRRQMS